jgi:ABC-type bacteriocin/lantibiotic exporter with double-glycine peptidase domain
MAYLSAFLSGLGYPSLAIIMGSITNTFDPNSENSIKQTMLDLLKNIMIVAALLWILGYMQYALFQQIAERIAYDLRGKYLRALLKQEVGFFEKNNVESMPSDIG